MVFLFIDNLIYNLFSFLHVSIDPLSEVADLSVDPRVEITPAPDTPADNTSEVSTSITVVADHGATRVTLAAVLAMFSCTQHALRDGERILDLTSSILHNRDINLHQDIGSAAVT